MNYQSIYDFLKTGEAVSETTENELNTLTQQYPWFESGQVLSAIYKHKFGKDDAALQLQKAQLYLNNPLWLNWQIMKFEKDFTETSIQTEKDSPPYPDDSKTEVQDDYNPVKAEPIESKNELLSFDPLYTRDYFASQGIKLQQEQLGNDHLSQQVKTFTQWLKSMKKIYHENTSPAPQKEDGEVIQMADASNRNEEIYTETMAEVLITQGKKKQAVAIYEKLSLLYPEKSSYFTARISDLNS